MMMKRIAVFLALAASIAQPLKAGAGDQLEGQWRNPKGSVVVRVAQCGAGYCGTVVKADAKAREKARKGGTPNLIGTRIITDVKPIGTGMFRGRAFDPKRNIHAPATIRVLGPTSISIKGCLIGGMICKEQRWTRVS